MRLSYLYSFCLCDYVRETDYSTEYIVGNVFVILSIINGYKIFTLFIGYSQIIVPLNFANKLNKKQIKRILYHSAREISAWPVHLHKAKTFQNTPCAFRVLRYREVLYIFGKLIHRAIRWGGGGQWAKLLGHMDSIQDSRG